MPPSWISPISLSLRGKAIFCTLSRILKTRDLAPKANVLRCRHHHTPQWGGGVALSMGGGGNFHGGVALFMGGVWLWSLLGWRPAGGGVKHRSRLFSRLRLFQRQRSNDCANISARAFEQCSFYEYRGAVGNNQSLSSPRHQVFFHPVRELDQLSRVWRHHWRDGFFKVGCVWLADCHAFPVELRLGCDHVLKCCPIRDQATWATEEQVTLQERKGRAVTPRHCLSAGIELAVQK